LRRPGVEVGAAPEELAPMTPLVVPQVGFVRAQSRMSRNTVLFLVSVTFLSPPHVVALQRHWQHGCNFRLTVHGYSGLSRRNAWHP